MEVLGLPSSLQAAGGYIAMQILTQIYPFFCLLLDYRGVNAGTANRSLDFNWFVQHSGSNSGIGTAIIPGLSFFS